MIYEVIKYLFNKNRYVWEAKEIHKYKSITNAEKKFKELIQKEKPEQKNKMITIEKKGIIIRRRIYEKK